MSITLRSLKWGTTALILAAIGSGFVFTSFEKQTSPPTDFGFYGFPAAAAVTLMVVGLAILNRRPGHSIGWIMIGVGLASALTWSSDEYAKAAVLGTAGLPGGEYLAWAASWLWLPIVALLLGLLPAIYPTGRFGSNFGRLVSWLAVPTCLCFLLGQSLRPGMLPNERSYSANPLSIAWLPHDAIENVGSFLFVMMSTSGAFLLYTKYKQGHEIERLQIRWLLSALAFTSVALALYVTWYAIAATPPTFFLAIGFLSIPIAIGFAITRYRLYEIDIVINRAAVYGPLTAVVAGAYVASVQLSRLMFVALTGERSDSELLTATLIAGAVFWMVRARMIKVVDQHFKDPREPAKDLAALRARLHATTEFIEPALLSPERVARQVLSTAVSAYDAQGGRLVIEGLGHNNAAVASGEATSTAIRIDIAYGDRPYGHLLLGPRSNGKPYSEFDRGPLAATADALGQLLHEHRTKSAAGL